MVGDSGWNNSVQYTSPDFNGLSGSAMYSFGNTAGDGRSKKYSAQFLYFHGPFAATGVYQYVNFNNTPGDLTSIDGFATPGYKSQSVGAAGRVVRHEVRQVLRAVHVHEERHRRPRHRSTSTRGRAA